MRAEAIRKYEFRAREKRGQCGADQPMAVKERHDDEAGVSEAHLIMRRNIMHRGHHIGMSQRYGLRPAGRAARVRQEGDVPGQRRIRGAFRGRAEPAAGELHIACRIPGGGPNRQAQGASGFADRIGSRRRNDDSSLGVLEEELKFVGLVSRVHWSRNQSSASGRQKPNQVFDPIR